MLILIRRVGETVMVGDDVKITIMAAKGVKTRIGIEAPKDLAVHREEVYRLIQQEHARAGQADPSPEQLASAGRTPSFVTGPDS